MSVYEAAIGIDLGTTNSCVAVLKNGVAEVIPNEFNDHTTPSMVTIGKDGTRLVGREAKNVQYRNLKNTIYESKRLIGRKFNEDCIQDRMLHWPFNVVQGPKGDPLICVKVTNPEKTTKYFHPEEISGMVLEKMKTIAEKHLGHPVTKAVVTVPAYFNDNQRQATMDAARIAKLEVLKIINEPTAAAFAYILKNNIHQPCNTLVFDLGGGTFDVSIIHSKSNQFAVVAVNGDPDLGGADFDVVLYNQISSIIQKQANKKIIFKPQQKRRIVALCVRVKEQLSDATEAEFDLPNIVDDLDFEYRFTRKDFESLISHLLKKVMAIVKSTLSDANLTVDKIDNIVLVGGSSRIPAVIKSLRDYFKKDVSFAINPDEAVACGAAFQAAILNNTNLPLQNVGVVDITPFSLGIEAEGRDMDVLIKKNTPLPATFTKMYTTVLDNQREIRIIVYQGEDKLTARNAKLAHFDLTGILPAPARVPKIWVTFDIDTNGVVHVSATETSSNETVKVKIKANTGRLSDTDFVRIEEENKEYSKKQKFLNQVANEKDGLLKFCFDSKRKVQNLHNVNTHDKDEFISKVNKVIGYLESLSVQDENVLDNIYREKVELQKDYNDLL